jgi:hypothetical protein
MFLPGPTPDNRIKTRVTAKDGGTLMVMGMALRDAAIRSSMMATGIADGMSMCCDQLDLRWQDATVQSV